MTIQAEGPSSPIGLKATAEGYLRTVIEAGSAALGAVSQGAAGLVTAPWYVRLSDGAAAVSVATQTTLAAVLTALSDGSQKAIVRGAAKGVTAAADCTSVVVDADGQALAVTEMFLRGYEDETNNVSAVVTRPLAVSTYAPSIFANRGANATLNVKGAAGNVYAVSCLNLNAAVRYLQIHNTATTPAGAAVPLAEFPVAASGGFLQVGADWFSTNGLHFSLGIAFAFSTTAGSYTAGAAGDHHTQVVYK